MNGIILLTEMLEQMHICHSVEFFNSFGRNPALQELVETNAEAVRTTLVELDPNKFWEFAAKNEWLLSLTINNNGNTKMCPWEDIYAQMPQQLREDLGGILLSEHLSQVLQLFVWFFYAPSYAGFQVDFGDSTEELPEPLPQSEPVVPIPSPTKVAKKSKAKKQDNIGATPRDRKPRKKSGSKPSGFKAYNEDASLDLYLKEIGETPLINQKEEVRLAKEIKQGSKKALDKLVKANLRFVVSVAKQYQNQGLGLSDLINEGNIGLMKAAKRFDETRGFKFISYAVWWIRQAILQSLAENSRIVRLPLNRVGTLHKIGKTSGKLEQLLGRQASPEEIAKELELSEAEVADTMKIGNTHLSLDAPFSSSEDGENSLLDVLEDDGASSPDVHTLDQSMRRAIAEAIDTLTDREAEVITLYFGLGPEKPLTLEEIGARYSLTRERVRQIKEKAIRRLRHASRARKLQTYHK